MDEEYKKDIKDRLEDEIDYLEVCNVKCPETINSTNITSTICDLILNLPKQDLVNLYLELKRRAMEKENPVLDLFAYTEKQLNRIYSEMNLVLGGCKEFRAFLDVFGELNGEINMYYIGIDEIERITNLVFFYVFFHSRTIIGFCKPDENNQKNISKLSYEFFNKIIKKDNNKPDKPTYLFVPFVDYKEKMGINASNNWKKEYPYEYVIYFENNKTELFKNSSIKYAIIDPESYDEGYIGDIIVNLEFEDNQMSKLKSLNYQFFKKSWELEYCQDLDDNARKDFLKGVFNHKNRKLKTQYQKIIKNYSDDKKYKVNLKLARNFVSLYAILSEITEKELKKDYKTKICKNEFTHKGRCGVKYPDDGVNRKYKDYCPICRSKKCINTSLVSQRKKKLESI